MTVTPAAPRTLAADDVRLDAWRAFLVAHARLFRRLDDELRAEHDLSFPEYDALLQLAQAPDRRLRMSRLADRVLLSKSGVTRLIDRLEADGSVTRDVCQSDGRGAEAVLTAAGLQRLRRAAVTHLRGVEHYFVGAVDSADLGTIERTMRAIATMATDPNGEAGSEVDCDPAEAAADGRARRS